MKKYQFIYHDEKNDRFSIYKSEEIGLSFLYWRELTKHNISRVNGDEHFDAEFTHSTSGSRNTELEKIEIIGKSDEIHAGDGLASIRGKNVGSRSLEELMLEKSDVPLIIVNGNITGNVEIEGQKITREVAFIGCTFTGHFIIRSCDISQSLWLSNSQFKKQFSLKKSIFNKSVHLEGASFSGEGGASFRGLSAQNLYLDLDIEGCNDMIWINEVYISGELSVGGSLKSDIQIMGDQEASHKEKVKEEKGGVVKEVRKGYIGRLNIGKEFYGSENSNKTILGKGKIVIRDMYIGNGISLNNIESSQISMENTESPCFELLNTTLSRDLSINNCHFYEGGRDKKCTIEECNIDRFLKIENTCIQSDLSLSGTSVGNTSIFRNNLFSRKSQVNLFKFFTERMIFFPEESLYGEKSSGMFRPSRLNLIDHKSYDQEDMGEIYSNLKNWFSRSGRLKLEDVSYFHLRDFYSKSKFERFFLGLVFGWGVRLRNIAFSSTLIIFIFTILYWSVYREITSFLSALLLSSQSFISSFFGAWESTLSEKLVSAGIISTVESYIGVLFITVFVGAYIRKLLR